MCMSEPEMSMSEPVMVIPNTGTLKAKAGTWAVVITYSRGRSEVWFFNKEHKLEAEFCALVHETIYLDPGACGPYDVLNKGSRETVVASCSQQIPGTKQV